jgi:hypothetical protein
VNALSIQRCEDPAKLERSEDEKAVKRDLFSAGN